MAIQLEPTKDYTVTLNGQDLSNISMAIMELPARIANPLLDKLSKQFEQPEDTSDK